jgi:hypothetical protein
MNRAAGVLALATAASLSLSCSESSPSGPGATQNSLVFTRADRSEISFSSDAFLYVWCGPWEEGLVVTPSVQVLFGGPGPGDPRWHLRAVVADVTIGQPLAFPNGFVFDLPKDVDLFVADLSDDPANELSSQDARSSGSITFQKLQCGSGGEIQFSIDAVIGSEFHDGPSVNVRGTFRAAIDPPSR